MAVIKNIIFDFGGILLDLDYKATDESLKDLFQIQFDARDYPEPYLTILDEYEMGLFGEGSFMHRLQRTVDHVVTERQILDAWNAMLLGLPKERLDWVLGLRDNYTVYLLSNTNHSHIQYLHRVMLPHIGVVDFEQTYFEKVYYSHKVKMRKPNHDIYEYVINDAGIDPAESIFIDDNLDNINAAREVGLHAAWHDPKLEIMEQLAGYLDSL